MDLELTSDPLPPPKKRRRLNYKEQQAANVKDGLHPLGFRLANNGEKCKTCYHVNTHGNTRAYYKCTEYRITAGPGTDIRLKWPACIRFKEET